MAAYIKIEQIKEEYPIYYYLVSTKDVESPSFYMGIDAKNKKISFFDTMDFSKKPLKIVDTSADGFFSELSGINRHVYVKALMTGVNALKIGVFPRNLDYHA